MQSVPPLGSVEYQMRDRSLPPLITIELRIDSGLQSLKITEEEVKVDSRALAQIFVLLYMPIRLKYYFVQIYCLIVIVLRNKDLVNRML